MKFLSIVKATFYLSLALLVSTSGAFAAEQTKILASIKPLKLMLLSLVDDEQVEVLVDAQNSPHSQRLKPSDAVKLRQADLVIWVGDVLESSLAKSLSAHKNNLELLPILSGEGPDEHDHDDHGHDEPEAESHDEHGHDEPEEESHDDHGHDEHEEESHDDHGHGDGLDPHIWLSPELTAETAKIISRRLQTINPAKSRLYQTKLIKFLDELEAAETTTKKMLAPYKQVPFISLHDGYEHLVDYYGLNYSGYVYVDEHSGISPKNLVKLRQYVSSGEVKCILAERPFPRKPLAKLVGDAPINQVSLDLLGIDTEDSYITFLERIARDVRDCLS